MRRQILIDGRLNYQFIHTTNSEGADEMFSPAMRSSCSLRERSQPGSVCPYRSVRCNGRLALRDSLEDRDLLSRGNERYCRENKFKVLGGMRPAILEKPTGWGACKKQIAHFVWFTPDSCHCTTNRRGLSDLLVPGRNEACKTTVFLLTEITI